MVIRPPWEGVHPTPTTAVGRGTPSGAGRDNPLLARDGFRGGRKRVHVQTYDVTELMKRGPNAIGAALADGWYRGKVGLSWSKVYGDTLGFIARIKLTYADGSTEWVGTDGRWLAGGGPFVRADLQDGETYDAARERPGWDTPTFDGSG